jgi:drug/metabolite transporter (DMT)-like permease
MPNSSNPENKSTSLIAFLAIIFLALIWGSSFILVKKSLIGYSPMEVGALRIFAASVFFIPVFLGRKKQIEKSHWKYFLLAGLTGNLFPALLFSLAGQHLTSALSGMLNAFTPLFTLILGVLFFSQKFQVRQAWGIVLGLVGCFGLLIGGKDFHLDFNIHALWVVFATFLYGINMHLVKNKLSNLHPLTSTAGIFITISPFALGILYAAGFFEKPIDQTHFWPLMAGIALGFFGSALGMLLFNQIIKWTNAIVASSVTYLIPIVALSWGLFDGEAVYLSQLFFMLVLLFGVYQVNKK